jgi:hypothetical protein
MRIPASLLGLALALVSCRAGADYPSWQRADAWPDRVIVTLTRQPDTSFSVNWRTDDEVRQAVAEIARATPFARFDLEARTVAAMTERFELDPDSMGERRWSDTNTLDIPPVAYHGVTFTGLQPDTVYAYRVRGAPGHWSPWRQVRTAPAGGPVEFLYFGDAQNGIRSHVGRLFGSAAQAAPAARFMLHAGDLVNSAMNDLQWAEWFEAGGRLFQRVPSIPVPGNHDYVAQGPGSGGVGNSELTPLWRPQFTLPVEPSLPDSLAETAYAIRYGPDLHLFAVDSTGRGFDAQIEWLRRALGASDATWKVVYMHHPYFSWVGSGEEKPEQTRRRGVFDTLLAEREVDLVLTGHRHSYQRAESGPDVDRRNKRRSYAVDTVYVVTASTANRGTTKTGGWARWAEERGQGFTLTRWGDFVPLFGVVRIDGSRLHFRALDALGGVYDEFTLTRSRGGKKSIRNAAAAFGPTRHAGNTGPYAELEFNARDGD